ncbi:MAG: hypothetical protein Q4B14_02035 [Clostridia bacterium]|nr:hypothetical protein [Clostridia bacterium]
MVCSKCHKSLPEGSLVCGFCGNRLLDDKSQIEKNSNSSLTLPTKTDSQVALPDLQPQQQTEIAVPDKDNDKKIEKEQIAKTAEALHRSETKLTRKSLKKYKPMSTIGFFFTQLVLYIPVINIILLFVWSFRKNTNRNRKSFARSNLIWLFFNFLVLIAVIAAIVMVFRMPVYQQQLLAILDQWRTLLADFINSQIPPAA